MSSALYRSYLKLLERWPVHANKKGRDLGEYIRSGVGAAFRGSDEPRDTLKCEEICKRLTNISTNRYKEAFYVTASTSASGLSQQECHEIMSNEFLKMMEEKEKSMKEKISGAFSSEEKSK